MRPLNRIPLPEIRATTYKRRDSWWTVLLVDPLASRLVWLVAPYRWITPNRLSVVALILGIGSAACFATGDRAWLAVGALLFHLSFVIDCMDGKIARLNGTGSIFGAWLDYLLDRVRVVICAAALFGAQYAETRNVWFLVLGGAVAFLDAVHHVNALETARLRMTMAQQLATARARLTELRAELTRAGRQPASAAPMPAAPAAADSTAGAAAQAQAEVMAGDAAVDGSAQPAVIKDPAPDFRYSSRPYAMVRHVLVNSRIRSNLISTIELHMAVFIVAPLTGAYFSVCVGVGLLLMLFDGAKSYVFYLNTKRFQRRLATANRQIVEAEGQLAAATDAAVAPDRPAQAGLAHAV